MNISIFGLGYVGCVGMACLASQGHRMIGVDVSEEKVKRVNSGLPTIIERDIDELMAAGFKEGLVSATTDYREAVLQSDISFICVGTPSASNGHLDLTYLLQTASQTGEALRDKMGFHIVVIRSTVFPGTNARICDIIEEQSGKKRGEDFAVVSNPEFLREGTAVKDYLNPPLTVLGSTCPRAIETMKELYSHSSAPVEVVAVEVAEMIKYVNNSYHALKVTFANEVGAVCKQLGVDSHEVMRIFCQDKELNISPYYFKPGFAYGGSCLPKDLLGLKTLAGDLDVSAPVLNSIGESNDAQIERLISRLESLDKNKIGILGLSFKAGTDDMRNSPIVKVISQMLEDGRTVRIYDRNVSVSRLIGKNKIAVDTHLPELEEMLCESLDELVDWADVLVVANKAPEFAGIVPKAGQKVIDLVRISALEHLEGYDGLSW